jgi:hypothetical protein
MNSLDFIKQAFEEFVQEWELKAADKMTINDFSFILKKAVELETQNLDEQEKEK